MAGKGQQVLALYVHNRVVRIRSSWKEYLRTSDAEHLHRYRVEVKKLMALLHFVKWAAPEFKLKKTARFITKSFKLAGHLRDNYNYRLLARKFKYTIPVRHANMAKAGEQESLHRLKKRYARSKYKLAQLEERLAKCLAALTIQQLQQYVHQQLTEITGEIGQGLVKKEIHHLRKKLKDLYYLEKILAKEERGLPLRTIRHINTLQDLAGQWHDIDKFRSGTKLSRATVQVVQASEKRLLAHIHKLSLSFLHPVKV